MDGLKGCIVMHYSLVMFTEIHCVVTGKVQGVAYRDFVQNTARELTLMGWVKNNNDGSVELLAQGLPEDLKTMTEALHEGSILAEVAGVKADWRTPVQHFEDFVVIYQ